MEGLERESREGELLKGKYQLAERLGVGGMGEVYRARNLLVDRTVAIKVLHRDLARDPHVIQRFLREAKAANVVRHRNIADVLDIDTADDGVMFIVEEYLEGEDLLSRIEAAGGQLSPKETLDLLIPVAEAVGAAHAKGLVHRDLKPDNVFLALVDDQIVPKVLDFGISKIPLQEAATAAPQQGEAPGLSGVRLTSVFGAIGTPAYMSPEQIKDPCSVDARTDVWALGVMLYEAIGGDLPFMSDNLGALFAEICTREAVPLERLAPDVTKELSRIVHRCLRADAAQRFANAAELARALAGVRRSMSEPVPAATTVSSGPPGSALGSSASVRPDKPRPSGAAPPAASAPPATNPFALDRAKPFGVPAVLELAVPKRPNAGPPTPAPFDWELEAPIPVAAKVPSMSPRPARPSSEPAKTPGRFAGARADAFDLDDGIDHMPHFALDETPAPAAGPARGLPAELDLGEPASPRTPSRRPGMAPPGASAPPPGERIRTPISVRSLPPADALLSVPPHSASSSTHRRIALSGIVPRVPTPTPLELTRFALCCLLGLAVGLLARFLSPSGLLLAERTWASNAPVPFAAAAALLATAGLWVFVRAGRGPSVALLFAGLGSWVLGAVCGIAAAVLAAPGLVSDTVRNIGLNAAPWAAVATLLTVGAHAGLRAQERRLAGARWAPMTVSLFTTAVAALSLASWVAVGPRATSDGISRWTLAPIEMRTPPKLRRFAAMAVGARAILHEPGIAAAEGGAATAAGLPSNDAAPRQPKPPR